MNKLTKISSLVIAIMGISSAAHASDAIGPGDNDARWILGGGAVIATNIYAGEDDFSYPFPNIVFNGERLFIKDGSINYSIGEWGQFSTGVTARYDASFLSFKGLYKDNDKLTGLEERDATIEGGFYINHTTDMGRLNFSLLTDLSNKHDGHTATLQYILDLRVGNWYINPMVGVNWVSSDKVNHYYGVSAAEATASRLSYQGDSTYNYFAGVRGRYEINSKLDVNIVAGVNRLGSGITDSSIVEEDTAYFGSVSLNYAF